MLYINYFWKPGALALLFLKKYPLTQEKPLTSTCVGMQKQWSWGWIRGKKREIHAAIYMTGKRLVTFSYSLEVYVSLHEYE